MRDIVTFEGSARGMAILNIGSSIAPALALVAGGALAASLGWRGLFWLTAAIIVVFYIAAHLWLRETRPPAARTRHGIADEFRGWLAFLRSRVFVAFSLSQGFFNGALFAFMAGGPFYLIDQFGISPARWAFSWRCFPLGSCLEICSRR